MDFALSLLPPGIDPVVAVGLIALSYFTSAVTAAFALGGGMLLLSALVVALPPIAIVPVHGLVQLGSNAGRAVMRRDHVVWPLAAWMMVGAVPGALIGGQFVTALPERAFALSIGLFILVTTWVKLPPMRVEGRVLPAVVGAVIGALGMFISATGPLTALFLRHLPDRREVVATHAAILTAQHLSKILVFMALGFVIGPWLPLVGAMILSGLAGTWSGGKLLDRLPETVFRTGLKVVLTIIGLDLLRRAIVA